MHMMIRKSGLLVELNASGQTKNELETVVSR